MMVRHSERALRKPVTRCTGKGCTFTSGYWYHDTEQLVGHPSNDKLGYCAHCQDGRSVSWRLSSTREYYTAHDCESYKARNPYGQPTPKEWDDLTDDDTETDEEIERKAAKTVANSVKSGATELADVLSGILANAVDETKVRKIVDETFEDRGEQTLLEIRAKVDEALAKAYVPTRVEYVDSSGQVKEVSGLVHAVMPKILKIATAKRANGQRINIFMRGPAGTGKSSIPAQVAEALELPYDSMPLSIGTMSYDILGYRDANGNYQDTSFRRIYEGSGVFLFDECDNANPNALVIVNEGIANGSMAFPDKRVERHSDCIVFAAGNTNGSGADSQYAGRVQLDAAFLDRFVIVQVGIDEALESTVAHAQGCEAGVTERWLAVVRRLRGNTESLRLKTVISPRATYDGCVLLREGFTVAEVTEWTISNKMSAQDWERVNG